MKQIRLQLLHDALKPGEQYHTTNEILVKSCFSYTIQTIVGWEEKQTERLYTK